MPTATQTKLPHLFTTYDAGVGVRDALTDPAAPGAGGWLPYKRRRR